MDRRPDGPSFCSPCINVYACGGKVCQRLANLERTLEYIRDDCHDIADAITRAGAALQPHQTWHGPCTNCEGRGWVNEPRDQAIAQVACPKCRAPL